MMYDLWNNEMQRKIGYTMERRTETSIYCHYKERYKINIKKRRKDETRRKGIYRDV